MYLVFRDFVEGVREGRDVDDMRAAVAKAAGAFELNCFAYFAPAFGEREATFFSTYPTAWTDHYFRQGYDTIDPVFDIARSRCEPFRWGRDVVGTTLSAEQRALFDEAATFRIRNGLTIPLSEGSGAFAALTFAADATDPAFEHTVHRNLKTFQFMAIVLHSAVRRNFKCPRTVGGVRLTLREVECLRWASLGKSAWEISRILGLARRTVSFHLENAKAKLGVRSVCQAVALFAAARH